MAGTIIERDISRSAVYSPNAPSSKRIYDVFGTESELDVQNLAQATIPAFDANGLRYKTYEYAPVGGGFWEVYVTYGAEANTIQFDTTGGTQHITQALDEATYAVPHNPPLGPFDFKSAIGMHDGDIDGCDITVPVFTWRETYYIPIADVTQDYIMMLRDLTGTTNDGIFRGQQSGEVLFMGATGSQKGWDDMEITFVFAGGKNKHNFMVAGVNVGMKEAWDYLWVYYEVDTDPVNNIITRVPRCVVVDVVYDSGDFTQFGIGN